eukprot:jgi/Chlat1/4807/Chrsp31S04856
MQAAARVVRGGYATGSRLELGSSKQQSAASLAVRVPKVVRSADRTATITRCAVAAPREQVAASRDDDSDAHTAALYEQHQRVYNFSAGPACLPVEVLLQAQEEMLNWRGSGMSVMEMSHRGKEFTSIIQKAEVDLRTLLSIPDNYKVLFLQGGATTQFAAVPLNITAKDDTVDYLVTGSWSVKGVEEANKYCKVNVVATGKPGKFTNIPPKSEWNLSSDATYLHICANETIQGVEFKDYPEHKCLVADMSSNFCSKPIDVSKFGIIYAGAQKNIGAAGVTVVIVRDDLLGKARPYTPVMLDYKTMADNESLYNTPSTYSIYTCGLVFEHLLKKGGIEAVQKINETKAQKLYDAIEGSNGFYKCPVAKEVRSMMNVPFTMATPELEKAFLAEASKAGLSSLKGHRSVGGVRASIYNAMPVAGVDKLIELMQDFQQRHS